SIFKTLYSESEQDPTWILPVFFNYGEPTGDKKRRLLPAAFSMYRYIRAFYLLCDSLTEAHEDGCNLCTGRGALRYECGVRTAGDQAVLVCPLHRRSCVAADLIRISVLSKGHAADRGVIALVLRVTIQDRRHLLAGDRVVRREGRLADAVYNTVCCRPG